MAVLRLFSRVFSRMAALALLLAALILPAVAVGLPVLSQHRQLADDVADGTAKLARVEAALREERGLAQGLAGVAVADGIFVAGRDEAAQAAAVQARLVELAAAGQVQLLRSGQLAVRDVGGVEMIGTRITFHADMAAVQRMLHAIEGARPLLFVEVAELRAELGPASAGPEVAVLIDATLDVYGATGK
jgi:hypothetical protein